MSRPAASSLALLLLAIAAPGAGRAQDAPSTDLAVVHGRVWDAVGGLSSATAVLCRGGRVVAVGGDEAVRAQARPGARVLDAGGGLVLPGFHDAHAHLLMAGEALTTLDLDGCTTLATTLEAVRRYAAAHPDLPWLVGRGWSYEVTPGSLPTRQDLDQACPDRPVVLESYDGHTLWANTRALAAAKVGPDTRDPPDGRVAREADGRTPAGALLEGAGALLEAARPTPTRQERLAAIEAALARDLALGITAVDTIASDVDEVELWRDLERRGRLALRVTVSPPLEGDLEAYARLREALAGGEWLRLGFLKGFLDGVIESRTAFMLAPYSGPDGAPAPDGALGAPLIPPDRLRALVRAAHARGFPVALHAIGDAAVRLALDAYADAARADPGRHVRSRIEHIEVVHPDDLPRFRALDVVASMQPYHAVPSGPTPDADTWSVNLGPERLARSFAWRALADAGATLAFGSDWPVMTQDPLRGLAVAVTRQNERGEPAGGWRAQQALGIDEALRAFTVGSAYGVGREADEGRLAPGFVADLVVLSPDVDLTRPASLWTGHIAAVVTGGVAR